MKKKKQKFSPFLHPNVKILFSTVKFPIQRNLVFKLIFRLLAEFVTLEVPLDQDNDSRKYLVS